MLSISWSEKKSNLEVLIAAGVKRTLMNTIRQRQLNLGHVTRRHGLKNLVVTGKAEEESEGTSKTKVTKVSG